MKYIREGTPLDQEMFDLHKGETAFHQRQYVIHERLKKHHHTIMALTKNLKEALEKIN